VDRPPADEADFEMVCHYVSGWATEAELRAHIRELDEQKKAKSKKS